MFGPGHVGGPAGGTEDEADERNMLGTGRPAEGREGVAHGSRCRVGPTMTPAATKHVIATTRHRT